MANDSSSKLDMPDGTERKSYTPKAFHTVAQGRRRPQPWKGCTIIIRSKNRLENAILQLVEPFQGSFISTNDYPGWRGFAAYPGLRCATPSGYSLYGKSSG